MAWSSLLQVNAHSSKVAFFLDWASSTLLLTWGGTGLRIVLMQVYLCFVDALKLPQQILEFLAGFPLFLSYEWVHLLQHLLRGRLGSSNRGTTFICRQQTKFWGSWCPGVWFREFWRRKLKWDQTEMVLLLLMGVLQVRVRKSRTHLRWVSSKAVH